MPELPEVESARSVIERSALGRTIAWVDDSDTYECRPHRPGEIAAALTGRSLLEVHRRGKTMWCETSRVAGDEAGHGGPALGIHLGMSGRIVVTDAHGERNEGGDYVRPRSPRRGAAGAAPPVSSAAGEAARWDRFRLGFADGGELRLVDKRRLGRVRLNPDVEALGPDAGEITRGDFRRRVGRGSAPIKARLLDQATLAGVGNLLADESLWRAAIDPRHPAGDLATEDLDELRRALRFEIRSAIRKGGVHTGEVIPFRAQGAHCPRCGAAMHRGTVGGRTTWWCSREQA